MPSRKPQTFHFAPYNFPAPFPTPKKPLFLIFPPILLLHQTLLGAFPVQGPRSRPPRTPSPAEKGAKRRPGLRLSLRAARKSPPPLRFAPPLRASCAVCVAPARPRRSTAGLGGGHRSCPQHPAEISADTAFSRARQKGCYPRGMEGERWRIEGCAVDGGEVAAGDGSPWKWCGMQGEVHHLSAHRDVGEVHLPVGAWVSAPFGLKEKERGLSGWMERSGQGLARSTEEANFVFCLIVAPSRGTCSLV